MVNHIRTLLMNRRRDGHSISEHGEEYIPATYTPRVLSPALHRAHQVLFGSQPDRLFLNYRMRQLMQLLHSTPLAADAMEPDPRITYLPFKDDLFTAAFGPRLRLISGTPAMAKLTGRHVADSDIGITTISWEVEVLLSGKVTVKRLTAPTTSKTFPGNAALLGNNIFGDAVGEDVWDGVFQAVYMTDSPTATGPQTVSVPLAGSELQLFLYNVSPGYRLRITSSAKPDTDILPLLFAAVSSFGETGLTEIFPPMAPEPVAAWNRIWHDHHLAPMRFAALLLATAYRIEQLPIDEAA